jgi:hypothetical protein
MLHVSAPAAARMAQLLNPKGHDAVLRIIRRKDRLRLHVSVVREGDQTFMHNGRIVLALDERMRSNLSRRHLDVGPSSTGPRLKLKPS